MKDLKVENDDILKLIRSLNIQEAHGPHDISIRMIKICDSVLVKPLVLIVALFLTSGRNQISVLFTKEWQKNY